MRRENTLRWNRRMKRKSECVLEVPKLNLYHVKGKEPLVVSFVLSHSNQLATGHFVYHPLAVVKFSTHLRGNENPTHVFLKLPTYVLPFGNLGINLFYWYKKSLKRPQVKLHSICLRKSTLIFVLEEIWNFEIMNVIWYHHLAYFFMLDFKAL